MTTTVSFGLGSVLLLLTAAFTPIGPAGEEHSAFLGRGARGDDRDPPRRRDVRQRPGG